MTESHPQAMNRPPVGMRASVRWLPAGGLATLVSLAGWLVLWQAACAFELVPPLFLPPPGAVVDKFVSVARDGFVDATLLQHAAASLGRVGMALLVALATAIPVGLATASSPVIRGALDPLIEIYRPIPPLAYLPLVVIWFGIGEVSKILLIYLAMFAPIALATAAGVRRVAQDRIDAARSMGASRAQVLSLVVLPSALPDILVGVRIGLGAGWSTLVAAELVAATRGIGFMIQSASQFLVTDIVVMGIFVIAAIAFAFELVIRSLERALTPWRGKA